MANAPMPEHREGFAYLDIETAGLDSGSHPVIAAAYQRMDANGPTEKGPTLLTSWGSRGERSVLRAMADVGLFIHAGPRAYDFIPVGSSLDFTLAFAAERVRITRAFPLARSEVLEFLARKPRLDLKGALVLMNRGAISGAAPKRFSKRRVGSGSDVTRMYHERRFEDIEAYIRAEAAAFFDVFPAVSSNLRNLGDTMRGGGA